MKSKMTGIFIALVLSMSVIGFSYAQWYSSVYINGTATLGTLDLEHSSFTEYNQTTPKATVTATYPVDNDHLVLTIDKVYPGWKGFFDLTVINKGNLPLRFYSFQLTGHTDNYLVEHFWLGFVRPDVDQYNVYAKFSYFATEHTYEEWGVPKASVTLQPGAPQMSRISIEVDDVDPGYMGVSFTATFALKATTA